jgi:hypothetical protein
MRTRPQADPAPGTRQFDGHIVLPEFAAEHPIWNRKKRRTAAD